MRVIITIKHKLGIFYWQLIKRFNIFKYDIKKNFRTVFVFIFGFFVNMPPDYSKINQAETLIICAHPDDETIFFYSIIDELRPYVICMSNRGNRARRIEFKNALNHMSINGVLLNFPDILNFRWELIERVIRLKLKKIKRKCPGIKVVYTHNDKGESKHQHHFAVSRAVQNVFYDKQIYLTSEQEIQLNSISEQEYKDKEYIIREIYKSQYKMLSMWCSWFSHYMRYEYFEKHNGGQ